jgi:hypothetical protein
MLGQKEKLFPRIQKFTLQSLVNVGHREGHGLEFQKLEDLKLRKNLKWTRGPHVSRTRAVNHAPGYLVLHTPTKRLVTTGDRPGHRRSAAVPTLIRAWASLGEISFLILPSLTHRPCLSLSPLSSRQHAARHRHATSRRSSPPTSA